MKHRSAVFWEPSEARQKTIKKKILLYILPFFVISALISVFIGISSIKKQGQKTTEIIAQTMLNDKREKLKDLVSNTYEILAAQNRAAQDPKQIADAYRPQLESLVSVAYLTVEKIYKKTDLSPEAKMEEAKQAIATMRYGGDNYIWINDTDQVMIMHPGAPQFNGKKMSGHKDPNGKLLFDAFNKVAMEEGQGYVDYMWPKAGEEKPVAKLAYVRFFKPWNWIIGTGVYLEVAKERFKEEAKREISSLRFGMDNKDYFFILDSKVKMVMHPTKPELNGQDQSSAVDANGKKYFAAMIDAAREKGSGYVDYLWQAPGESTALPKLAYVKHFPEWDWIVGTGVYVDDLDKAKKEQEKNSQKMVTEQGYFIAGISGLIILLVGCLISLLSTKIISPIKQASLMLQDIAQGEGDLTRRLDVNSGDELADLSRWFNVFVEKLQKMIQDIGTDAHELLGSSMTLADISKTMSDGSASTAQKTTLAATATEQMSENMTTISQAVEEATVSVDKVSFAMETMTRTINEIADTAEKARHITEEAVVKSLEASKQVDELGVAAKEISKVLETISEISDQVDLLALNATIEAARAGEAGKGFAVVASEIKELAKQTSEATGQIRDRIEGIQNTTNATVKEIRGISEVVSENNEIVNTIATAVEEQSSTASEIAQTVHQMNQGIRDINQNVTESSSVSKEIAHDINEVYRESNEMNSRAQQVSENANRVNSLAEGFTSLVGKFKV